MSVRILRTHSTRMTKCTDSRSILGMFGRRRIQIRQSGMQIAFRYISLIVHDKVFCMLSRALWRLSRFAFCLIGLCFLFFSKGATACIIMLSAEAQLPVNSVDLSNATRVKLAQNYLVAREWTTEGATAAVYAGAYESEHEPLELAEQRGERTKAYLIQLGFPENDVTIDRRLIKMRDGKPVNERGYQVIVEFVPKCPLTGCNDLCNAPTQGAVSKAIK